eukprot:XP_025011716.1 uncharacterized protein LOC112533558 isoform X2 [Gallus gallus]
MRWRFLWRRVVIGPRRPALCRHHPEPRGGGGGGGHAEVVPGSTLLQRRRAAPGLRAPLQLLRVGVRGWGGCVLLCVVPVGPLRCSGPLLGGGRCPVPPTQETDSSHQKKPPYSHQVMLGQPPVTPGHCCVTITRACLQPDLVTLELSRAVTIMCHQDGDVVVYSAATRGDCV